MYGPHINYKSCLLINIELSSHRSNFCVTWTFHQSPLQTYGQDACKIACINSWTNGMTEFYKYMYMLNGKCIHIQPICVYFSDLSVTHFNTWRSSWVLVLALMKSEYISILLKSVCKTLHIFRKISFQMFMKKHNEEKNGL